MPKRIVRCPGGTVATAFAAFRGAVGLLAVAAVLVLPAGSARAGWVSARISGEMAAGGNLVQFSICADGSRAVYLADQDTPGVREVYSAPIAGGGSVKLNGALVAGGNVFFCEVCPVGSRVAYRSDQETDEVVELYSVPIDGSAAALKLNGPLLSGSVWDGKQSAIGRIVYRAEQDTAGVTELYSVPIDGSAAAVKINGALVDGGSISSWDNYFVSADGSRVVYRADQETPGTMELFSVPIEGPGAAAVKISAALDAGENVLDFAIARDSARVVYRADQDSVGVPELYSVPITGGAAVKLNGALAPGGTVSAYLISADGGRVVYRADQDTAGTTELYSVPTTGGVAVRLNEVLVAGGNVMDHAISADSARVVYRADQEAPGMAELYSVPIGGGAAAKLNGALAAGGNVTTTAISADSSRVVYIASQQPLGRLELYSAPIAGGAVAAKLNGALVAGGRVKSFQISPTSARVVYLADQLTQGLRELFVVPIAGGAAPRASGELVPGGYIDHYGFTNDGAVVVYSAAQRSETVELFASREEVFAATFVSQGAQDGWVLESHEASGAGRTLGRDGATLCVGDDALDRQYLSLLSFDTAPLPDNAVLLGARVSLRQGGFAGRDPSLTHGSLVLDLRKGAFSSSAALQAADFRAASSLRAAVTLPRTAVDEWRSASLGTAALRFLNRGGPTQFRLRFARDDDDDHRPDVLLFASGDAAEAERPVLEVTYTLP